MGIKAPVLPFTKSVKYLSFQGRWHGGDIGIQVVLLVPLLAVVTPGTVAPVVDLWNRKSVRLR